MSKFHSQITFMDTPEVAAELRAWADKRKADPEWLMPSSFSSLSREVMRAGLELLRPSLVKAHGPITEEELTLAMVNAERRDKWSRARRGGVPTLAED